MKHSLVFFVVPGFNLMDFAGPIAAFEAAETISPGSYRWRAVSMTGGQVASSTGISVATERRDRTASEELVIVGGRGPREAAHDQEYVAAVDELAANSARIVSICTGAFLLASTGRLNGRRVTTHWQFSAELQRSFPDVRVQADSIYIQDGPVWTSGGVTAGIDLALGIIEADLGASISRDVARELVVYHRRLGGQAQFSKLMELSPSTHRLQRAWAFAREHIREALPVERLAAAASLSPRQFARAFQSETGMTPARAVERLRVELAALHIQTSAENLEALGRIDIQAIHSIAHARWVKARKRLALRS